MSGQCNFNCFQEGLNPGECCMASPFTKRVEIRRCSYSQGGLNSRECHKVSPSVSPSGVSELMSKEGISYYFV